jgi:ketosteroid isomerase-like protein
MKKILPFIAVWLACMTSNAQTTEVEAVKSVLNAYKKSLESLDTTGIPKLFIKNARVFEQAKDEGSIQNYLTRHLGPELQVFKTFTFSDYKVDVTVCNLNAFATETYLYTIVLAKDGSVIKSQGVATSVLVKTSDGWKIELTHSSFRKLKQ